jgi:anti-anti-sigma factor
MSDQNPHESSTLTMKTVKIGADAVALHVAGQLDATGAPALSRVLSELLESGTRNVELDFAHVDFISSTGIGTLIAAVGEYRDVAGDIVIANLSRELREVFEMLDLLDYVTVK